MCGANCRRGSDEIWAGLMRGGCQAVAERGPKAVLLPNREETAEAWPNGGRFGMRCRACRANHHRKERRLPPGASARPGPQTLTATRTRPSLYALASRSLVAPPPASSARGRPVSSQPVTAAFPMAIGDNDAVRADARGGVGGSRWRIELRC